MKETDGWVKIKKYTDDEGKPVCGDCPLKECRLYVWGGILKEGFPGPNCPVWHGESKSEWQPIGTCPVFEFNQERWYDSGPQYLLWVGHLVKGRYGYTKTGKGRWQSHYGNITPTHWMPLPSPPQEK